MRNKLIPLVFSALLGSLGITSLVQAEPAAPAVAMAAQETRVNINEADAATLTRELNGIGPAKAQAIVDYREEQGAFVSVDELLEVKGIGVATLEKLRSQLTVE